MPEKTQKKTPQKTPEKTLEQACRFALEHNLAVTYADRVLIVFDETKKDIAAAFATAASERAREVEVLEIPVPPVNGAEPPREAAAKMAAFEVVLLPLAQSISWTRARRAATEAGARLASMPRITEDILLRTCGIDYGPIKERVNALADLLDRGRAVRITTAAGTDLTFSIAGRQAHGRKAGLYTEPGHWGNLPCGEAFIAPVEGTAEGIYVVDASQAGVGRIEEPIVIEVAGGRAVDIRGGRQAEAFAAMLAGVGDERARNIAEFGIGANDHARICGIILEDEKVLGTCHIALGNNAHFGGTVEVGVHVDGVMRDPTITIDGVTILAAGHLVATP